MELNPISVKFHASQKKKKHAGNNSSQPVMRTSTDPTEMKQFIVIFNIIVDCQFPQHNFHGGAEGKKNDFVFIEMAQQR